MRKAIGDNSFSVRCEKIGGRYHLQVTGVPGLCAEHASFAEAEALLVDRIHDRFGELGIQLIHESPKPISSSEPWWDSGWVLVLAKEFLGTHQEVDTLFSQGRCKLCRLGVGSRNLDPIILPNTTRPVHMGYVAGSYPVPVVSAQFLNLFSGAELSGVQPRRYQTPGTQRRREFFELLPKELVGFVDVASTPDMVSWKCDVCGRVQVDQYLPGPFRFTVREGSLPGGAQLALVGFPFDYNLAVPQGLWERIRKSKQLKGIRPEPLGMTSSGNCVAGYRLMLSQHWKVKPSLEEPCIT